MIPALIITGVVIFDLALVGGIMWWAVNAVWRPLRQRYPARDVAPDAVRRNFQSFRFGAINFGGCIHVAVDEDHLHLIPARLLRWFGASTVSIPWASIAITGRPRLGRILPASFDGRSVAGPAWCLRLAEPPEEQVEGESH
jgi:hypothetical protein